MGVKIMDLELIDVERYEKSGAVKYYIVKNSHGWLSHYTARDVKRLFQAGGTIRGLTLDHRGWLRMTNISNTPKFTVEYGDALIRRCRIHVGDFKPRDCVREIVNNIMKRDTGSIIALSGLSGTGKTIAMYHSILQLSTIKMYKVYLIAIDTTDTDITFDKLCKVLAGIPDGVVFIDSINYIHDVIENLPVLSNVFTNLRFVVSASDSAALTIASRTTLINKCYLIRTSIIRYDEFKGLKGDKALPDYINYGSLYGNKYSDWSRTTTLSRIQDRLIQGITMDIVRNRGFISNNRNTQIVSTIGFNDLEYITLGMIAALVYSRYPMNLIEAIQCADERQIEFLKPTIGIPIEDFKQALRSIPTEKIKVIMQLLIEIDIFRLVNNFAKRFIALNHIPATSIQITDDKLCTPIYGLSSSLQHSVGYKEKKIIQRNILDNMLVAHIATLRQHSRYSISEVGYLRYSNKDNEINIPAVVVYRDNITGNMRTVLIKITNCNKIEASLTKDFSGITGDMRKIVVYFGNTQDNYINIEEFLLNTWEVITGNCYS